jgi:hypothetical protein
MACTGTALPFRYVSPVKSVFAVWAVLILNDRNILIPGREIEWCHAYSQPLTGLYIYPCVGISFLGCLSTPKEM